MNKAICWIEKSDEHFTGNGTEYQCGNAYTKMETAMVDIINNNGDSIAVDINDSDFIFIFRNGLDEKNKDLK